MHISGDECSRQLHKDDNTVVNIGDDNIVKYTGKYYPNKYNLDKSSNTTFIGNVFCQRYYDGSTKGIYIHPLFMYWNEKWHKIVNYKYPTNKYFLYPHLITMNQNVYRYEEIPYLDTVTNVTALDMDICNSNIDTIDLYYQYTDEFYTLSKMIDGKCTVYSDMSQT